MSNKGQRMTDAEWRAKYGDKPRLTKLRGRAKLRHGRQARDVRAVLTTVYKPGDLVRAIDVWDLFDESTRNDWMIAYGRFKCIPKVQHVLGNITSGNTHGPSLQRDGKRGFIYEPADELGPLNPVDVVSRLGIMQEAEASVALDGETQSFEDTLTEMAEMVASPMPTEELPKGPLARFTLIGYNLDGDPLFKDYDNTVGTIVFTPLP
ncbi:MAG: hypothetical protein ACXQS1_02115 [Methermicoccaceae archaeon]